MSLARDDLDRLFGTARPSHPFYYSLREAYSRERDPARRATIAANLDRWRWMPRTLGARYLLVNAAAFEATLWEGRKQIGRWAVIVGKTGSPTPVFAATVTRVTFNPWWEIPTSIVAESVGALVRNRPAEAARKGYVVQDGRYRQRPGANNALGRMKLVMPNPYSVYIHDTPSQGQFEQDVRAFSHGCIRVGDALGLATALLAAEPGWDRARSDGMVAAGSTVTVPLAAPVPVYVTYFTAEPDGEGGIRYFPDVYHRDRGVPVPGEENCPQ
jgi:murein L,D-transpeptidase YcbB/YkuD